MACLLGIAGRVSVSAHQSLGIFSGEIHDRGKCCVSGAGEIRIDYKEKTVEMNGKVYKEGDWISLNGSTGEVYDGSARSSHLSRLHGADPWRSSP